MFLSLIDQWGLKSPQPTPHELQVQTAVNLKRKLTLTLSLISGLGCSCTFPSIGHSDVLGNRQMDRSFQGGRQIALAAEVVLAGQGSQLQGPNNQQQAGLWLSAAALTGHQTMFAG